MERLEFDIPEQSGLFRDIRIERGERPDGRRGPLIWCEIESLLSCPLCRMRYDPEKRTRLTEGYRCQNWITPRKTGKKKNEFSNDAEKYQCLGYLEKTGKPCEPISVIEISIGISWIESGRDSGDRLGRRFANKWFTKKGAEMRKPK